MKVNNETTTEYDDSQAEALGDLAVEDDAQVKGGDAQTSVGMDKAIRILYKAQV